MIRSMAQSGTSPLSIAASKFMRLRSSVNPRRSSWKESEVKRDQDMEKRERNTIDFSEGRFRLLATKKELSGSGCNFQRHCHRAIFLGIDYEFNDFIQAIHRIYRFLQTNRVVIDIIYMDTEQQILKALQKKKK